MNDKAIVFAELLNRFDKEACARWIEKEIKSPDFSIKELYFEILSPCLSNIANNYKEQKIPIWQEHLKTSIVRTMVEMCYFYVLKNSPKPKDKGKIIVSCMDEEQHDLGARMICDLFTLEGFDVIFLGANTDKKQMILAIEYIKPIYYAISITNYFHLTKLEKALDYIRSNSFHKCKFIVGGFAISNTPDIYKKISADIIISTTFDLEKFLKGELL